MNYNEKWQELNGLVISKSKAKGKKNSKSKPKLAWKRGWQSYFRIYLPQTITSRYEDLIIRNNNSSFGKDVLSLKYYIEGVVMWDEQISK